jgi:ubiquinone/menaquinone biosynthesis C-methylase UbiE
MIRRIRELSKRLRPPCDWYDRILQRDEEIEMLRAEVRRLTAGSGPTYKLETRPVKEESYKNFWEQTAATPQQAMAAVDGSADEETLQVTGRWTAEQVAHALLLQKSDHVLELGCGIARVGRELAPLCGCWRGVDISENMLKVARSRTAHLPNVEFSLLSGTSLAEFPGDAFDKAYSVTTLIHLDKEDLFLYLRELARVLRPGGLLYFDTWNLAHEIGWKQWLKEVEHWANSDQSQRKHVARNQFCMPEEVQLYVKKAGFAELCCLSDSVWIQEIAAKPGEGVNLAALQEQVRANLAVVAFSPLWNQLFDSLLKVLGGQKKPEDFWQELKDLGPTREAAPYRPYLLALWKTRQYEWGSAPQE